MSVVGDHVGAVESFNDALYERFRFHALRYIGGEPDGFAAAGWRDDCNLF